MVGLQATFLNQDGTHNTSFLLGVWGIKSHNSQISFYLQEALCLNWEGRAVR